MTGTEPVGGKEGKLGGMNGRPAGRCCCDDVTEKLPETPCGCCGKVMGKVPGADCCCSSDVMEMLPESSWEDEAAADSQDAACRAMAREGESHVAAKHDDCSILC